MAELLKELQAGGHRCLIFTQMSRMLDVLEAFLSYHNYRHVVALHYVTLYYDKNYRYLRLDGATKIAHRQLMMEQFNQVFLAFIGFN